MVKVTDKDYYMDNGLKEQLDFGLKCISKNWDYWCIVDGVEGSAKTTVTCSLAYYMDNRFNLNNVVFTTEQFQHAVDTLPNGSAIVWDEAVFGMMSSDGVTKMQKTLVKKSVTMRKKQMKVFLVMPWFFMFNMYFATGRSRSLIHVYSPDGISRGYFNFYGFNKKKQLYIKGKKYMHYGCVLPDLKGRFTDTFGQFFNEKEYDAKKESAIKSITEEAGTTQADKREEMWKERSFKIFELFRKNHPVSYEVVADYLGITKQTLLGAFKKYKVQQEGC